MNGKRNVGLLKVVCFQIECLNVIEQIFIWLRLNLAMFYDIIGC